MTKLAKTQSLFELDNNMQSLYEMLHEIELNQDLEEDDLQSLKVDLELALEITEKDKKQKLYKTDLNRLQKEFFENLEMMFTMVRNQNFVLMKTYLKNGLKIKKINIFK